MMARPTVGSALVGMMQSRAPSPQRGPEGVRCSESPAGQSARAGLSQTPRPSGRDGKAFVFEA